MITYWQQEDGKLIQKEEEELNTKMVTWVDARVVTRDDIVELQEKFDIEQENMLDILDPDELSRIEYNDEKNYNLAILRLPVFSPTDDISYFCAPLGIITKGKYFITICWTDCEVLKDFAANRIRELNVNDFPAFTIRFMARADLTYLRYLKEINRRATTIQNEMLRSVHNHELIQLLNIQKSLTYFTTSLKSNQMLLEKVRTNRVLKLDEEDKDWLDDVEIDNRQAMEMADNYSNIMAQMNDAFAGVLSNNLNIVMKTMTAWNLILMMPTLVTSFFGMNVPLPWDGTEGWKWMGVIMLSGICVLSAIMGYFVFMKSRLTNVETKRKPFKISQHRAARKQKKIIKQTERAAEKAGNAAKSSQSKTERSEKVQKTAGKPTRTRTKKEIQAEEQKVEIDNAIKEAQESSKPNEVEVVKEVKEKKRKTTKSTKTARKTKKAKSTKKRK